MYTSQSPTITKPDPCAGLNGPAAASFEHTVNVALKESQRKALVAFLDKQNFCESRELYEIAQIIKKS